MEIYVARTKTNDTVATPKKKARSKEERLAELAASVAVDKHRINAVDLLEGARAAAMKARSTETAGTFVEALKLAKQAVAVLELATGAKPAAQPAPQDTAAPVAAE